MFAQKPNIPEVSEEQVLHRLATGPKATSYGVMQSLLPGHEDSEGALIAVVNKLMALKKKRLASWDREGWSATLAGCVQAASAIAV